jgi:hypothetical protein
MTTKRFCGLVLVFAAGLAPIGRAGPLLIVDNLPGEFTDISGTGIDLHLGDDASAAITSAIGNLVFPEGRVAVGNNGGIGFDPPGDGLSPENQPLPSGNAFGSGQSLLPYWDDIGDDTGGPLWSQADNVLIAQWNKPLKGKRDTVRFQIKVFGGAGANDIFAQFIYADIQQPLPNGGASATIGYQDGGAGFNDVQWSYNTPGAVLDGTVLSLIMPEPAGVMLVLPVALLLLRRR